MKTLYKIGMLAVAALAFAGCSKEVDNFAEQSTGTHTLTFTVQKDVDTRTAVVEGDGIASYVWTEGDKQYFHIYENGVEATATTMVLSTDKKIATFKATFKNTDATEFSYTATYGSDLSNTGNPVNPSNQTPALNSFDPAADVLVSAEPITFEGSAKAAEDAEFQFKLKRVVSANKMTLKGLTVGERIYKVELTSDKYFSSRYSVDNGGYTGDAKTLVLDYENIEAYAGADGTFPVYFISAPIEDATFSVRVVTDGVIYTRDDFTSKLTLAVGTFRRFGINLSGYDQPIMSVTEYTKVESVDQIADGGKYLIVEEENSKAAGPYNDSGSTKYYDAEDVVISNGKISIQTENASVFTLEAGEVAGQYYIKDQMGYYLKWVSGNSVERSDVKYLWTVTTTGITSVETSDRRLQYNSGNPRFACYTSAQKAITLYVDKTTIVELADPELSFAETTVNVAWGDIEGFTAPTLSYPQEVTVSYSSSNEDVATVNASTGEITFVGNGTTVITASSEKTSTYKAGSAQYTLVVTGAPVEYDFTTVAQLNSLASENAGEVTGTLTNAIVSFVPSANDAIIKDASGSILYHKNGHGLKQGQSFTGETRVTTTLYNGVCEITAINAEFTGEETAVAPETVAIANIASEYNTWQGAYVKVENLEVDSVSGKNVYVKNGEGTYLVYSNAANATCVPGDIITVVGTVTKYSGNPQIKVWSTDGITVTQEHPKAKHTITFAQPEEGGTFTVSANGAQISSGTELDEDTVVTLAATAADGFTFSSWTVSGATVSGNTETATFTVGTANVTIAAEFISNALTVEEITGTFTMVDGALTLTTSSGITIVQAKGTSSTAPNANYATASTLRIYDGNTITFSGKTITKIEFTHTSSNNGGANTSSDVGTYTRGSTSSIWEGESTSVTITNTKASGASNIQIRPTKIVVTYK